MTRTRHEVNLSEPGRKSVYRDGSEGVNAPLDMPVFIRAYRLMGDTVDDTLPIVKGLKGWTLEINAFTHQVRFYIRIGMIPDRTLTLFVKEGNNPTRKVGQWERTKRSSRR